MLTTKAEDYLEAILVIEEKKGYTRVKDLASLLAIKPPSVVEMLKKLHEQDLVEYRRYDGVRLTPQGRQAARVVKERHETIRSFLELLQVPKQAAEKDACLIEHNLEPETLEQLRRFVRFARLAPEYPQWLKHFERYCEGYGH
jgi:DtxR family Mn-dependent transcriptional regulator